jgi:hypothetical protein
MLKALPDHVLRAKLFIFFDYKDLVRIEYVSHHFHSLLQTNSFVILWKRLLQRDFLVTSEFVPLPKQKYVSLYCDRKRYIKVSINNSKQLVLLQAKSEDHFRIRGRLILLTSSVATFSPFVLLLLFTSMLMNKLNKGSLQDVPYAIIFIPVWILILIYIAVFVFTCYAARNVNNAPEESGWRDQWVYLKNTVSGFIIDQLLLQNKRAYVHCAILGMLIVFTPIMLCIKLDAVTSLPWTVTMLPIFLALGCWLFSPICNWVFRNHLGEFLALNVFLWLPTVVVLSLMAAKLDGAKIATHWVFMPYWIIDGLVLCFATIGILRGSITERRQNQDVSCLRIVGPFCATYTVGCCLLAPLVIFCAFLSVNEYHTLPQTTIFAPLLGWFVLTSLISCCLARGITHNNKLRRRREVSFSSQPRLVV